MELGIGLSLVEFRASIHDVNYHKSSVVPVASMISVTVVANEASYSPAELPRVNSYICLRTHGVCL